jgi:phosphoribosylamine--glycine ligase
LVLGVVDLFQAAGLPIFGPTQLAAQLEGSKAFSKEFMQKYGIPTGSAVTFTDFDEAARYLRQLDVVPVIKASGLAAGKGVILPVTMAEAAMVIREMLEEGSFGDAGTTVLVEDRMEGPEVSVLAFCDGANLTVMPAAQDHKRLLDKDYGPNTGGMGAFAPSPLATADLLAQVRSEVLEPALAGMAAEGMPYVGVLYAGVMLTDSGIKVLEFNCRFGDPETQVILPLLESDLAEIFLASIAGTLDKVDISWRDEAAATVVMASDGYPGEYTTGVEITRIDAAVDSGALVFHAGTKVKEDRLLTDGGRVLAVTGLGPDLKQAADVAYRGVRLIHFNNAQYRKDIATAWRR